MTFLLKCPQCRNESFQITFITFSQIYSDYQITFKCSRTKSSHKIYLRKLLISLNKENPTTPSYCDYHQFNHAPFICSGCESFLCKACYTEHLFEEDSKDPHVLLVDRTQGSFSRKQRHMTVFFVLYVWLCIFSIN